MLLISHNNKHVEKHKLYKGEKKRIQRTYGIPRILTELDVRKSLSEYFHFRNAWDLPDVSAKVI